jgi:hypothetical protein
MTIIATIRALSDSIDTITMSTDELLANAQAAMRWRDEVGESAIEIYAESMALRFWEALNERLMCGDPVPAAWAPGVDIRAWFGTADPDLIRERVNAHNAQLESGPRP